MSEYGFTGERTMERKSSGSVSDSSSPQRIKRIEGTKCRSSGNASITSRKRAQSSRTRYFLPNRVVMSGGDGVLFRNQKHTFQSRRERRVAASTQTRPTRASATSRRRAPTEWRTHARTPTLHFWARRIFSLPKWPCRHSRD